MVTGRSDQKSRPGTRGHQHRNGALAHGDRKSAETLLRNLIELDPGIAATREFLRRLQETPGTLKPSATIIGLIR